MRYVKYPYEITSDYGVCNGKRCYDKKGAVTAKNKRYKDSHTRLRVYNCPYCGYWHLTKSL